jgi:hypothetical protein
MLKYGGGGHKTVGTCQVSYEHANGILHEILHAINKYNRENSQRCAKHMQKNELIHESPRIKSHLLTTPMHLSRKN